MIKALRGFFCMREAEKNRLILVELVDLVVLEILERLVFNKTRRVYIMIEARDI
ncbi:hypothetical protein VPHD480_0031 [Vibrio phage D480]